MTRAVVRLVLMMLVTVAVLVTATALGFPTAAVLGLAVVLAGLVGLIGLSRRRVAPDSRAATDGAAASDQAEGSGSAAATSAPEVVMAGTAPAHVRADAGAARAAGNGAGRTDVRAGGGLADPLVASMAREAALDPEAQMPRWRRPSLLAARKADPLRVARIERPPLRFAESADPTPPARRVVRYAVVALLDRPDEVLGRQLIDLLAGDEVEVLESGGAFWEVRCPDGLRGFVHRTTLGLPGVAHQTFGRLPDPVAEPDDLLSAVLSARGIR